MKDDLREEVIERFQVLFQRNELKNRSWIETYIGPALITIVWIGYIYLRIKIGLMFFDKGFHFIIRSTTIQKFVNILFNNWLYCWIPSCRNIMCTICLMNYSNISHCTITISFSMTCHILDSYFIIYIINHTINVIIEMINQHFRVNRISSEFLTTTKVWLLKYLDALLYKVLYFFFLKNERKWENIEFFYLISRCLFTSFNTFYRIFITCILISISISFI
jgi:hypothetical protein